MQPESAGSRLWGALLASFSSLAACSVNPQPAQPSAAVATQATPALAPPSATGGNAFEPSGVEGVNLEPPVDRGLGAPPEHDAAATARASAQLRQTLRRLAAEPRFALGHEDSTDYGVGWKGSDDHSDVKAVCGTHVAVYGWDLFRIEKGQLENGDGVNFARMKLLIEEAYARGGIITISWHVDNPKSGGDAWDTTRAVEHVLPGGSEHLLYLGYLDRFAEFVARLRGPRGEQIPVIVRPYHEHTGSWFWWGKAHASEEEYRALWRLTVDRWREHHGLSHLLFAFSPSGGDVTNEQEYLYGYPGDAYVDVLGGDYYYVGDSRHLVSFVELTVEIARARGKVPALTEFGPRGGVNGLLVAQDWLGQQLLAPLLASERGLGIAYALAWRNAREDHAFLPYPGHGGEADLRALCEHPAVVMQRDLSPLVPKHDVKGEP